MGVVLFKVQRYEILTTWQNIFHGAERNCFPCFPNPQKTPLQTNLSGYFDLTKTPLLKFNIQGEFACFIQSVQKCSMLKMCTLSLWVQVLATTFAKCT